MSRAPVFQPEEEDQQDVLVQTIKAEENDLQLQKLVDAATNCAEYQKVKEAVVSKVNLNDLPDTHPAKQFRQQWNALSCETSLGLLTFHGRIVVPREARKTVLESLHVQHTGMVKTWRNARQLYFWPGIKNDINLIVSSCQECVKYLASLPKEPIIQSKASRPFEAMSADLCTYEGKDYLICVDRYSGWPLVEKLNKLDTTYVTKIMEEWFIDVGKPLRIRTDGGPQFRQEFDEWCQEQGIVHELTSPYHPESNGHAESAVKEMKHLIAKTETWGRFRKALIEWRNTPRCSDDLSPAQWALGRRQRSSSPALPKAYDRLSDQALSEALNRREEVMAKVKKDVDAGRKTLTRLPVGTFVVMQDHKSKRWIHRGTIVEKNVNPKRNTYVVEINGKRYLRNRIFLRPCLNQDQSSEPVQSPLRGILRQNEPEQPEPEQPELRRSKRQCVLKKKKVRFERRS